MYLTFEYREVKSMTEVSFHINYSPKAWDRLGMSLIFKQKQICVHQIYSNWLNMLQMTVIIDLTISHK